MDINKMSERQALGLPEYYMPLQSDHLMKEFSSLFNSSPSDLLKVIDQENSSLSLRYAAGVLLGYLGDSRINTYDPPMQLIPGGKYLAGIMPDEIDRVVNQYQGKCVKYEWIEKESPAFTAELNSYRLAVYPVTNYEYREFLIDSNSKEIPGSWLFGKYPDYAANHPVYGIRPEAADAYVNWLSRKTHRKFRLPTEIEWEYAAAGPNKNIFPWGNNYMPDRANTLEMQMFNTTPVGVFSKGISYFGLHDMAGNVEEYVFDSYWVYPGGRCIEDDLFKNNPKYRITRGGSFTRFSDLARCTRRHGFYPKSIYTIGFRLAETISVG